jgi:hypothetical protein
MAGTSENGVVLWVVCSVSLFWFNNKEGLGTERYRYKRAGRRGDDIDVVQQRADEG